MSDTLSSADRRRLAEIEAGKRRLATRQVGQPAAPKTVTATIDPVDDGSTATTLAIPGVANFTSGQEIFKTAITDAGAVDGTIAATALVTSEPAALPEKPKRGRKKAEKPVEAKPEPAPEPEVTPTGNPDAASLDIDSLLGD